MSIGFGGVLGSASGVPLPQAKGNDSQRAQAEAAGQQRGIDLNEKAEKAAGVGQTEEDRESGDRDADGRRLWERSRQEAGGDGEGSEQQAKDTSGDTGNSIDLTG